MLGKHAGLADPEEEAHRDQRDEAGRERRSPRSCADHQHTIRVSAARAPKRSASQPLGTSKSA